MSACDAQMLWLQHQQKGISPRMFKALVSRGHPEFSSNRQQDAQELLLHIVNLVEVSEAKHLLRKTQSWQTRLRWSVDEYK